MFNPYLGHFGNLPRRHLWTKNPNWSDDVTHVRKNFRVYYFETTGVALYLRHENVPRDVIVGELLRNKEKFSRKPGNWVSVICGQKIHTRMGMSGSVICGQKIHSKYFYWVLTFFEEKLVWEVSQRHLWTKNPDNFLRMTNRSKTRKIYGPRVDS